MSKITQLTDPVTEENVYPVTFTDGVYLPDGTSLTSYLNKMPYPIGTIIQSTCKQNNSGLHLADGGELAIGGTYDAFCQYVLSHQDYFPITDLATYQAELEEYGQCGKYVITDTYVKIPKITKMTESANSESELGQSMGAGLPNIKGEVINFCCTNSSGLYSNYNSGKAILAGADAGIGGITYYPSSLSSSSNANNDGFKFDASLDNPIYGNSTTVQPQSVKLYYYIVVATVIKTDIEVNIDNIASDLNNLSNQLSTKASVDAGNLSSENISSWEQRLKITGKYDSLWSGNISGNPTMTLSNNMFNYKWLLIYAIQDDSYRFGQIVLPQWFKDACHTSSTYRYVIATDSKYFGIYYVSDTQIQVTDHSSGTLWLVVRGVK